MENNNFKRIENQNKILELDLNSLFHSNHSFKNKYGLKSVIIPLFEHDKIIFYGFEQKPFNKELPYHIIYGPRLCFDDNYTLPELINGKYNMILTEDEEQDFPYNEKFDYSDGVYINLKKNKLIHYFKKSF